MSIQTFVSEFQDYLFTKRTYLYSLANDNLSASNIELAFKQTEQILEEFKTNIDFLEREGRSIDSELETMFNSLENKIDKINRFSSALIGINTTTDTAGKVLTLTPYQFDATLPNWEHIQKCYMLPPKSSYVTLQPYSKNIDETFKKGVVKFLIDDNFSTRYLRIAKEYSTNINNVVYLNSLRDTISSSALLTNLGQSDVVLTIPASTRLVTMEFTYSVNSDISLTPLSFYHLPETTIKLEDATYTYGDSLIFNTKADIPFGCYAQIKFDLVYRDVNENSLLKETRWYPIDNDGNILLLNEYIKDEEVIRVWKEGMFQDVSNVDEISANDYVLCKPTYGESFKPITESSFKLNVKHAATIKVIPTLYMYSILNQTSTPRIYSITGLTRND